MTDSVCFDRTFFVLVIIIIAIVAIYNFFSYQKYIDDLKMQLSNYNNIAPVKQTLENEKIYKKSQYTDKLLAEQQPIQSVSLHPINIPEPPLFPELNVQPQGPPMIPDDPVNIYDINNINNPFVYPTTRPASYLFRPMMNNPLFFSPTRGFPDKPGYIANLVEVDLVDGVGSGEDKNKKFDRVFNKMEDNRNDRNEGHNPQLPSVLQLMGLQKYPGCSKFDYYVLLPSSGNNPPIKYTVHTHRNEEVYDGDIIKVLGKAYIVKKNKSPFEYFVP